MRDVNDCVSQVKRLDPVLEEKKVQKRFFIHSTVSENPRFFRYRFCNAI